MGIEPTSLHPGHTMTAPPANRLQKSSFRSRHANLNILTDVTIYGVKYLTKCITQDRECGNYLFEAFEMYNAFNETQKVFIVSTIYTKKIQ